jgi:phage gpG-like protein
MGFVFHPTVLRVQQPHLILNELRHFKIQLDQSPIMDALFSPATVPIPPSVPWPTNFVAQRYLPPPEVFQVQKYPIRQEVDRNEEYPQSYQNMRRAFPIIPSGQDIERTIAQSMAQNSANFQSQFKFPNFPSMRRYLPPMPSGKDIEKSIAESMARNSERFQSQFNFPQFPSTPNNMRRINLPGMPSADSIQKSIAESMAKNSALFGSKFIMPDISKAIDGIIQSHVSFKIYKNIR